jgi:hypothetical protein
MTLLVFARGWSAWFQKLLRLRAKAAPFDTPHDLLRAGKYDEPYPFSPWITYLR